MPLSLDRTPTYTLPLPSLPAGPATPRTYVGMREVPASDVIAPEAIAQQALEHHRAAQDALDGHRVREAVRREWLAAAIGLGLLIVSLGVLLVANGAHGWL